MSMEYLDDTLPEKDEVGIDEDDWLDNQSSYTEEANLEGSSVELSSSTFKVVGNDVSEIINKSASPAIWIGTSLGLVLCIALVTFLVWRKKHERK